MTIGLGIGLMVIGAILSFAVRDSISGVDLTMVGYILMGGGALSLILGLVTNAQATNTRHSEVIEHRDDTV